MKKIIFSTMTLAFLFLVSCETPRDPMYREKTEVYNQTLTIYSDNVGVYPHDDVLNDPNNTALFANDDNKWDLTTHNSPGFEVFDFYAWATVAATVPTGENQLYTALALENVLETGSFNSGDTPTLSNMIRRSYSSILQNFEQISSFSSEGEELNLIGTAYDKAIEWGGDTHNWTSVTDDNDNTIYIKN